MFASGLIVFIPSMYSKYSHTCLRWQFGKMLWDGVLATPPSFIHSIQIICKESGGSATRIVCPQISQTAQDAGSFLCLQMSEVPKTAAAWGARRLFIYCHPLVYWGLHKTCLLSQKLYGPGCVLGISGSAVCLVCHFEKSHKFCFVLFCFKQRNFRICGEAGENTAS